MGNQSNQSTKTNHNSNSINDEIMNKDVEITGDINVYVCGNINTFLNCEDGFNYTASRNYFVLEQIFEKMYIEKKGNIQLKDKEDYYYQYEFRKKEKDKKHYNAFLFLNKADEEFLDNLLNHFYEKDIHNSNKNIVLFFGNDDEEIIKCIDKLYSKSEETTPILLIVKSNSKYSDRLTYINYIPDLDTIKNFYKNDKKKFSEDELSTLSEKALVNFINMKLFRIDLYYNQLGYNLNMINPMNETYLKIKINATIALLGYSGCGKSTLINLIFKELVAKTSTSSTDVTTKCSEYYLPVNDSEDDDIGQIRFLDFPGITEDEHYQRVVEPEIKKKMKEYKDNMEQIDVALFFISNGNQREFTKSGLELVELLHKYKIKIIFIINGEMKPFIFKSKKEKLRNSIENRDILYEDLSNLIHTDFYQHFKESSKNGISEIFKKIIEEIKIKDKTFIVEEININNYNEKLAQLSKCNRIFENFDSMNVIKKKAKIKADLTVTGYCLLTLGSSTLSLVVPVVDCAITYGYQVAMVYHVLNIYELKPRDYDIVKIILTGGETIILKNHQKSEKKKEKEVEKKRKKAKGRKGRKGRK